MQTRLFKYLALLTAFFVVFYGLQPLEAEAKTVTKTKASSAKKIVKKTVYKAVINKPAVVEVLEVPVSKCLTKQINNLYTQALKQIDIDVTKRGTDHEAAVQKYKFRINMAWEAMNDPYCGYGNTSGLADEVHSLKKSIDRARSDFLKETK